MNTDPLPAMGAEKGGQKFPPIYEHPYWWANRFGELEQFHASHTLNFNCALAIGLALENHYDFDAERLDAAAVIKEIVDKFGFERTMYVLASTVWEYAWDDCISQESREWARTIPCYDEPDMSRGYAVNGNTNLIDQLISQVQHDYTLAQSPKTHEISGADMGEEAPPMDSYEQLARRMEASYQEHYAGWVNLSSEALIEGAKEIAALQDTREFMAEGRGIDPDGVDYLLTLPDPLQAVADHWLQRMDDLSDFGFALDELCCRQNPPAKKSVLAQLHGKTAAEPPKPHTPVKKEEER